MLRTATVLTAMLATTIAVAACGGSSPSNNNTAGNNNTSASAQVSQQLKMAKCIRSHGVPDFPDSPSHGLNQIQASQSPSSGGSVTVDGVKLNVSPRTLQRAMQDCQKYAPQGQALSGAQLAKVKQGAIKMAECMRSHGVPNFADPQVSAGPGGKGIGIRIGGPGAGSGSLNPNSPAFQSAIKTCGKLIGFGPKARVR